MFPNDRKIRLIVEMIIRKGKIKNRYDFKNRILFHILRKKYNRIKKQELKQEKRINRYFNKVHLDIYFGVPGSGKTTFAAYLAKKAYKLGIPVYSNVPIKGCFKLDPKSDLGKFMIEKCLVIIDEAGLEHSNREFMKFSKDNRYFYKFHRHYMAKVAVFSQADDMDISIRNVAFRLHLVKKSLLPYFIKIKPMIKKIDIDDNDHQPKAMYKWDWFIFTKRILSPLVWKLFDTYDAEILEDKKFEKW